MSIRLWAVVLLVLATLVSGWLAWDKRSRPAAFSDEPRPDYVLYDFELIALDDQGAESMTLRAPQLARRTADESVDLRQPLFLLPDDKGHHWQLQSQTGWVSADGHQLILRGDVQGRSPEESDMPATRITTESLTVIPDDDMARTDDPVQITQPGLRQTGVGMELDTATRNLRLLSQVKTRYEPAAAR